MRQRMWRRLREGILALCVVAGAFLAITRLEAAREGAAAPAPSSSEPIDLPAPTFTLTDQFGRRVSLLDLRGHVVLLAFIDSECTTICPLTAQTLVGALARLSPAQRARVRLVAVNANPLATAVAAVRRWSDAHGMTERWLFLTGSRAALERVWRGYHVVSQVVDGNVEHTPAVYVIDALGERPYEAYLQLTDASEGIGQQAAALARDIERTLAMGPRPTAG